MRNRRQFLASGTVGALIAGAPAAGQASGTKTDVEMWRVEMGGLRERDNHHDFSTLAADVGFLRVPIDHFAANRQQGQDYRIRFARFPGPKSPSGPPVFYFCGGPAHWEDLWWLYDGGHGTRNTFALIDTILKHTDLVLIDHRGTAGAVFPKLPNTSLREKLPLDRPLGLEERREGAVKLWKRILEHQESFGVDLTKIATPQLAADVDMVRDALGYSQIRLSGVSNGTYRCREYLRQFPDRVHSSLLFVSHAYEKKPHPNDVRESVRRFDAVAKADPVVGRYVPDSSALLLELIHKFDRSPVTTEVEVDGSRHPIVLSGMDLAACFWAGFSSNKEIMRWPGRLWRIKQGDLGELAQIALGGRMLGRGNHSDDAYSSAAMPTPEVLQDYRKAAGESYFLNREMAGEYMHDASPLPRDKKTPFAQPSNITYIAGEWDTHTPIEAVKRIAAKGTTFVLNPRQGHEGTVTNDVANPGFCFEQQFVETFLTGGTQQPYAQPLQFDVSAFQNGK